MFLSSYENKIDKKGRVSVPSSFRAYLNSMGFNGFVTYPSFNNFALDACAQDRIEKLSESIDSLGPFEDKRDYFATSVLSESINLSFDSEGRVSIPEKLIKHAKIKSSIVFVGLGKVFQMWDPNLFEKFKLIAKKKSYINRSALRWENKFKKEGV
jgi:MraZ protein